MASDLYALDVKNRHELNLLRVQGVRGVGVAQGKIIIYTDSPGVKIPSSLDGVPTQVKVVGRVRVL